MSPPSESTKIRGIRPFPPQVTKTVFTNVFDSAIDFTNFFQLVYNLFNLHSILVVVACSCCLAVLRHTLDKAFLINFNQKIIPKLFYFLPILLVKLFSDDATLCGKFQSLPDISRQIQFLVWTIFGFFWQLKRWKVTFLATLAIICWSLIGCDKKWIEFQVTSENFFIKKIWFRQQFFH